MHDTHSNARAQNTQRKSGKANANADVDADADAGIQTRLADHTLT